MDWKSKKGSKSGHRDGSENRGSDRGSDVKSETHGRRVLRVEKEILFQTSKYLYSSFMGDLPGIVTLVKVIATADLRTAKVFFSVLNGSQADEKLATKLLQDRAPDVQSYLAKNMPLRYTPRLTFILDTSIEKALKIDQLIHEIGKTITPSTNPEFPEQQ